MKHIGHLPQNQITFTNRKLDSFSCFLNFYIAFDVSFRHYVCSDYDMEKVNTQWVRDEEKLKIDSNSR